LPATLSDVTLAAEMENGTVILGEAAIPLDKAKIKTLRLRPENPPALDEAVQEIQNADGIVIGPEASLHLLFLIYWVKGIRQAIRESLAPKLYVCNVMTQPGETDSFTVYDPRKSYRKPCREIIFTCTGQYGLRSK